MNNFINKLYNKYYIKFSKRKKKLAFLNERANVDIQQLKRKESKEFHENWKVQNIPKGDIYKYIWVKRIKKTLIM